MEQLILEKLELLHLAPPSDSLSSLQTLASVRALIFNPASSDATRCSVQEVLVRFLGRVQDPTLLRHAIKLLGDVADLRRTLSPSVVAAVRPFLSCGKRLAADALSLVISAAKSCGEGGLSLVGSVLDEDLVLLLASSRFVAIRSLLLKLLVLDLGGAAYSFTLVRYDLVLYVVLALTLDLYPSVRTAALDCLLVMYKNASARADMAIMECCYERVVMLLRDDDELVRTSAVRLVSELGQVLAATEGVDSSRGSDTVFLQLCSMARDMNMKVRVEVFVSLGKVKSVSENVLLQSLSKKVLKINNRGKALAKCNIKESKLSISHACGVFVHGVEDEFYEVRRAACNSLGLLTMFSFQFADSALNLLMDMLNDDAIVVQLQTLQTLFQMATSDSLKVEEKHMHMFLGTLANKSDPIRSAARKVLRVMKLRDKERFRSSIDGLLTNLETYPEDEEDICLVLFCIGKNHGKLAASFVKEFVQEIEPSHDGEFNMDRPRVAALLVLAISSPFSHKQLIHDIPAKIFLYAISLFGRICCSLEGVMNRDALLAYLCKHSGTHFSATESDFKEAEMLPHATAEVRSKVFLDPSQVSAPIEQYQPKETTLDEVVVTSSIKLILKTAAETWPLIQTQCTHKAVRTLRVCKEDLEMIAWSTNGTSSAFLAFALQYVQVIQLIAEVKEQLQSKETHAIRMQKLHFLLEKLNTGLRTTRYGFLGFSKEEECHVLELILLGCVLRLSKVGIWSNPMLRKLQAMISHLELLHGECLNLSDFVKELKNLCCHGERGINDTHGPVPINNLLELFAIEEIPFSGRFRHIKAELQFQSSDSENPLPFISGLPVGITFKITLYNISNNDRVWLRMVVDGSTQYAFLNLNQFGGTDEVRRCTVNIPFYKTPKAAFLLLKACLCLECPFEFITHKEKGRGGPKCETTFLCEEKDVYLAEM